MSDIHDIINDICYSIAVAALLGILIFIILADVNISDDMPIWKSQLMASTVGALLTAFAALGAIHYKNWWDNRINLDVKINPNIEEDGQWQDISELLNVSVRNKSNRNAIVIDSFGLYLHYDGWEHPISTERLLTQSGIQLPYEILPGRKLSIRLGNISEYREDPFQNHQTGEYNFPNTGCDLIARFEDQRGGNHRSHTFKLF